MEPPAGWLWNISTARAFKLFSGATARRLAHHALCAGIYHELLVDIDGDRDMSPTEANGKVGELLQAFHVPLLTKQQVFWIVVSDRVRKADPKKTSAEIAWSMPAMCIDYDQNNPFQMLSWHGETVWEFRSRRSGFPTWAGMSVNELIELERDVEHQIQTLREWRSGLGEEAEAWIRMWASRYGDLSSCATARLWWLDPREEWTLDFA